MVLIALSRQQKEEGQQFLTHWYNHLLTRNDLKRKMIGPIVVIAYPTNLYKRLEIRTYWHNHLSKNYFLLKKIAPIV